MFDILLSAVGFILIILLLTEEVRDFLKYLWRRLSARPGMKYLIYPLAAVLLVAAAGLILFALWSFVSARFSYD